MELIKILSMASLLVVAAADQSLGCTSTMSMAQTNPCLQWNGTATRYPATVTAYQEVDCHGCTALSIPMKPWYCPMHEIKAVETAPTPTTHWKTQCAATPTRDRRRAPPTSSPAAPALTTNVLCLTTFSVQPTRTAGVISTAYSQWTTSTVRLPCAGCSLTVGTYLFGPGQPVKFTSTTTLPLGTSTVYACQ